MIQLVGLAGTLSISFSAIFFRLAGVSPTTAAFFRAAYAVPALALVWLALRDRDRRTSNQRWMAFGSGLLLAVDLFLWHRAIEEIGAGLSTVLANQQVVFVGVAAWVLYGERPTRLAFALIPVVFLGVTLISGLGDPEAFGADPVAGVVFGIGAGIAYSGFLLVFRASNRGLAPPGGPLLDATAGAALGSLFMALFDGRFTFAIPLEAHLWLLALALLNQVLGWLLIALALPRLPALQTSVMLLVQPMATVLWGLILLDEFLSSVQWAGVALVVVGVATLATVGSVERREPLPEPIAG
ncbi:MAG: DMT family transporter [Actinomycetota bacterium]